LTIILLIGESLNIFNYYKKRIKHDVLCVAEEKSVPILFDIIRIGILQ